MGTQVRTYIAILRIFMSHWDNQMSTRVQPRTNPWVFSSPQITQCPVGLDLFQSRIFSLTIVHGFAVSRVSILFFIPLMPFMQLMPFMHSRSPCHRNFPAFSFMPIIVFIVFTAVRVLCHAVEAFVRFRACFYWRQQSRSFTLTAFTARTIWYKWKWAEWVSKPMNKI